MTGVDDELFPFHVYVKRTFFFSLKIYLTRTIFNGSASKLEKCYRSLTSKWINVNIRRLFRIS